MVRFLDSIKGHFSVFWTIFKRDMWARYAWIEWFLPFEILNLIIGVATYFFYATMFGGSPSVLREYGGDFVAYLILGMSLNLLLTFSMNGTYDVIAMAYRGSYWSGGARLSLVEYLAMAKIPMWVYVTANLFWGYCQTIMRFFVYFFVGMYIFGMNINPYANYGVALIAIMLGMLATFGIGLVSASMIWLIGAWHGQEPIRWTVNILAGLASGVYFPPEILPGLLRVLAYFLPQTYSMKAAKLAIMQGSTMAQLLPDLGILIAFCAVMVPIGVMLLKYSFEVGKRKGTLM